MQGDLLEGFPAIVAPRDLPWPLPLEPASIPLEVESLDLIVVTQSCDLVTDRRGEDTSVALCPAWTLTEAAEANDWLKSSAGREECRRGFLPAFHMLAGSSGDWESDIRIVNFREMWTLPLGLVARLAGERGPRPRLLSPYREHLAQAVARYYMRVGLPADIPSFAADRTEWELERKLRTLPRQAQARIVAGLDAAD